VFKHAILNSYIIRFAIMTASKIPGKRAVLLDGFAGRGRYPDRTPASGEHLLMAASKARNSAQVEVVLVEQEPKDFAELAALTDEYRARGVAAEALPGDVADHLPAVLEAAEGVPLFLFLDPCGANLPFQVLQKALAGARRKAWPRTEALLNISADLTRRAAGVINKRQLDHKVVALMDRMCGGAWWQQVALRAHATSPDGSFETAAEAVVVEYARRLAMAARMKPVVVPVRRQVHHQPVYHLVFLTRDEHGLWLFGDALAAAREKWLRVLGPSDEDVEGMLFNPVEGQLQAEHDRGLERLKQNILEVARQHGRAKLVQHTLMVFDGIYGEVPEKFVTTAVRKLEEAGQLHIATKARKARDWIVELGPGS